MARKNDIDLTGLPSDTLVLFIAQTKLEVQAYSYLATGFKMLCGLPSSEGAAALYAAHHAGYSSMADARDKRLKVLIKEASSRGLMLPSGVEDE